jgi:4-azaleucine resistance transporter AzlC
LTTTRRSYRDGARAVAPLAVAAGSFGAAFGVLAETAGMDSPAAIVMSATTFAGAAQFAATSVLDEGGSVLAAVAAAVLLNARYGAISLAVAPAFTGSRVRRLLESQLIVDESWAVAVRPGGRVEHRVLIGAGAALWLAWTAGTAVGAFAGDALGDPEALGLDGAFPALFLALLVPQLRGGRARTAALGGAAIATALVPFVPAGVPIVAAAAACVLGWRRP